MSQYSLLINKIIQTCMEKDASAFASLFTDDAKIQLNSQTKIDKHNLEAITDDYFSGLKFIKIDILGMAINEKNNLAFIEWIWSDYNLKSNTENSHQNAIVLEFKDNLIYRWREYKN